MERVTDVLSKLVFEVDQKTPALPLLHHGQVWHTGWDIPTKWAIDSNKQCWMDNAHGHPLNPVGMQHLRGLTSEDESLKSVLKSLGEVFTLTHTEALEDLVKTIIAKHPEVAETVKTHQDGRFAHYVKGVS